LAKYRAKVGHDLGTIAADRFFSRGAQIAGVESLGDSPLELRLMLPLHHSTHVTSRTAVVYRPGGGYASNPARKEEFHDADRGHWSGTLHPFVGEERLRLGSAWRADPRVPRAFDGRTSAPSSGPPLVV